jgi:hypothetical protein
MARRFDWDKLSQQDKVIKRGGQPVDEPVVEHFVSTEDRKRMRAARQRLLAEFRALPEEHRPGLVREFRKRLKAVCPTQREFRGAWEKNFAPLVPARPSSRVQGDSRRRPGRGATSPKPTSKIALAAVGLVKAHPGVMDQRTCVQVLSGNGADRKVVLHGLRYATQFGQFKRTSRDALHQEVKQAVDAGLLRERAGLLYA